MNINDSAAILTHGICRQDAHKSSKHDEVRLELVNVLRQCAVVVSACREIFMWKGYSFDACICSSIKTIGRRLIADNGDHVAKNLTVVTGIDDRLKIASVAADQHNHSASLQFFRQ